MIVGKHKPKDDLPRATVNEIKQLAMFMKDTGAILCTRDLLEKMGFNINTFEGDFGDVSTHSNFNHRTLEWSICSCGKWESTDSDVTKRYKEYRKHYESTK